MSSEALRSGAAALAAAYLAVTLAYAPIVALGFWHHNVLAVGTNLVGAAILAGIVLLAERAARPGIVHLLFALPILGIYLAGMVTMFPPESWRWWLPLYAFVATAWALAAAFYRAFVRTETFALEG